ncbi:MAG: glutamate carboxypeptidase [Variibacter sp.]|jgi:glutamate carboxypeptidase|nr:glutamate carboxypeptidase [Variibacter sp.]
MAKNGESEILEWLGAQQGAMLSLLEEIVNIDGGSYDKAGVDAVGARLRKFLEDQNIACETIANEMFGDALRATVGGPSNSAIMLMGHRDTVFPKGEPTRRPFRIENGIAYGPGVADMKAGLVMNAFVLAAFQKFGGAPAPLVGLFTSDEEIGSPACRPIIEAEARRARAVFNSEPGRPSGNVVTGRKGGVFMKMEIVGKAAHSGGNFSEGISAIEELARKITALHALTDLTRGTTVNVGLVSGGQTVNTVAPWATCEIDLRYVTPPDREAAMGKIARIIETANVPGTSAKLEIAGEFKPLVETPDSKRLFDHYAACANDLSFKVEGEFAGGCADSGFTSGVGTATICAVGPVGGKAHTPDEYLVVDSLIPRAQALALAVARLT